MSEDDDWFERALREDEEDAETDGEDVDLTSEDTDFANGDAELESGDAETDGEDTPERGEFGDAPDFDAEETDVGEDDADFGETDATAFGDADDFGMGDQTPEETDAAGDVSAEGFAGADSDDADDRSSSSNRTQSDDTEDDDLFEDDFASAFENAPGGGAGGGGTEGGASGTGAGDGFGGSGSGGFGSSGGGEFGSSGGDGFDDGGFGMDGDEGFGGFGDSDDSFDDEEFESDIPRIDVGIEGLDSMVQGGVPERSLITTIGSAGTGKTTFGLQFLHEALVQGENAVFITLEESHDRIVSTATEKGWAFDEYEDEGSLAVIDLDPIEMANSLTSIRNDLPRLIEQFGATRLVLDSVSLLEMMYDDQATRRNEVYDFTKSLKEAGVTTMLTSEASEGNPYASRHGIIEYLVDAVFVLRYIRSSDDFRETRLAVEIQKIRDANHSREIKPYSITNEGISVYRQANIF